MPSTLPMEAIRFWNDWWATSEFPTGEAGADHEESDDEVDGGAHGHKIYLGHGARHEAEGEGGDEEGDEGGHGDFDGGVEGGVESTLCRGR